MSCRADDLRARMGEHAISDLIHILDLEESTRHQTGGQVISGCRFTHGTSHTF